MTVPPKSYEVLESHLLGEYAELTPPPNATHLRLKMKGGTSSDGNEGEYTERVISLADKNWVRLQAHPASAGGYTYIEWLVVR